MRCLPLIQVWLVSPVISTITMWFVNYEFPRKMIEFLMQYASIFEVTIAVPATCLPISSTTKNDAHHLTDQCHALHPISDV